MIACPSQVVDYDKMGFICDVVGYWAIKFAFFVTENLKLSEDEYFAYIL